MSKEESKAQDMEEALINEDVSIVEDTTAIVQTDMSVSEADSMIEMESKEEKGLGMYKKANELALTTIGFTGNEGGEMNNICDIIIKVPSNDTPRVQEAHILIGHILCQLIEEEMFPNV